MPEETTKEIWHGELVSTSKTGTGSNPSEPTMTTMSWKDTIYGVRVPNYRWRIRNHLNATSSLEANQFIATNSPGMQVVDGYVALNQSPASYRAAWHIGAPHGGHITPFTTGAVPTGSAENDAAGAWYKSVRNKMSTFKGSVFAAESRDAKRMMWTRATKMISMISPYQRRLRRRWYAKGSRRARLKALSDSWLELQFGWLPLISDIEDAHKALNNPTPQYKRAKGGPVSHVTIVDRNSGTATVGAITMATEYTETTRYEVTYYGEVKARVEPRASGLQDFGFTVREFLPTAWEVIPWSFAIDYFTNVGDIITAASYANASISWIGKRMISSRIRTRTTTSSPSTSLVAGQRTLIGIASSSRGEARLVRRMPVISVEVPSLSWQLPSWKQTLNLAALAASRRLRLFH